MESIAYVSDELALHVSQGEIAFLMTVGTFACLSAQSDNGEV